MDNKAILGNKYKNLVFKGVRSNMTLKLQEMENKKSKIPVAISKMIVKKNKAIR